eukprot:gene15349-biopygen6672
MHPAHGHHSTPSRWRDPRPPRTAATLGIPLTSSALTNAEEVRGFSNVAMGTPSVPIGGSGGMVGGEDDGAGGRVTVLRLEAKGACARYVCLDLVLHETTMSLVQ